MASTQFTGLPMPVFTAFGWAEEEAAIKFALEQLELFAAELYTRLNPHLQSLLPYHGVDRANKYAYISTDEQPEEGIFFNFTARPMSFQVELTVTKQDQLRQIFGVDSEEMAAWHAVLAGLPEDWTMRIQQLQAEDDPPSHYQDVFKDNTSALDLEKTREITERAQYLNGEDKWATALSFTRKLNSERVATMGADVAGVIAEELDDIAGLVNWLAVRTKRSAAMRKPIRKTKRTMAPRPELDMSEVEDQFTYVAELQPLHLRRGFINLTPSHWPFFSKSARSEIQPITIFFDGNKDTDSTVWRLVPNDLARVVLSEPVKMWLQENFGPDDKIEVFAVKLGREDFEVTLRLPTLE